MFNIKKTNFHIKQYLIHQHKDNIDETIDTNTVTLGMKATNIGINDTVQFKD